MWRRSMVLWGLAILLTVPLYGGPATEPGNASVPSVNWPGWRGSSADGWTAETLPTRWSASEGLRWKTPIPGRGHSSPIVFDDAVYVTTADVTIRGALLQQTFQLLMLGLLSGLALCAIDRVAARCDPRRSPTARDLMAATAIVAAVLVLAVTGVSGDSLFDFPRGQMRGWMTSTVFMSLCVALAAACVDRGWLRLTIGIGAVVFAVFALAAFPSGELTFRAGLTSLRMQIAVMASAAPLLVGLMIVGYARGRVNRPQVAAAAVIVVLVISCAMLVLRHLLGFRDVSFPETTYVPRLSPWILVVPGVIALGSLSGRLRTKSLAFNLLGVSCGAVSALAAGAIAVELLAARSPYLAYQIGVPRLALQSANAPMAIALAAALANVILMPRKARARFNSWARHMPLAFAGLALSLGVVFFVRVNLIHVHTNMFRAIVSLDRRSGNVNWILRGLEGPQPAIDGRNSPATPTPVTDGRLICAYFGRPGLMCATTTGSLAWSRRDLGHDGNYGIGFSPVLSDGMLFIANDRSDGVGDVHAIDARTGATVWTHTFATTPTLSGNSRTPIVREVDGEKSLILWGMFYVKALSLRSGEPVWSYELTSGGDLVSSAVSDANGLYLVDTTGTLALDFARLRSGREPIRWTSNARANCSSPVLANGILFSVTDSGIATATAADTGELLWRHRLPGQYFASLVATRTAAYFTNSDGLTTVVAAEPVFRVISQNALGEETVASMAAAGGVLFIRSAEHLYAVGSY